MATPTDDNRALAHGESLDDLVAHRLDPVRIAADLTATLDGIDELARAGIATTFAVVALGLGSWASAVTVLDGAANTRRFVERFTAEGVPTLWHANAVVAVRVFGVAPEDVAALADVARGRWYLPAPDGSDRVLDPTTQRIPRADRRRQAGD